MFAMEADRSTRPSNGRLLQLLAFAHALVGVVFFRRELRTIRRNGVARAIPMRGDEATAFWFLIPTPLLWIAGRLLDRAEAEGDARALREASGVGLASALLAALMLPVSGFWGWVAVSMRGLHDARRMRERG
jgi:Family of unknown function (DUF6463)